MLQQRGFEAEQVRDGDSSAQQAGLLILVGHGMDFPRWAAQFVEPTPRPRTLLWQLEPLPPPGTTDGMHAIGRQIARAGWQECIGGPGRFLEGRVPLPRVVRGLVRRWHAARLRRELLRVGGHEWDFGAGCMMQNAIWLHTHAIGPSRWIDDLVCSLPTRVEYLREQGIPSRFVPVGYHRLWGEDRQRPRDIDMLFIGRLRAIRRARQVRAVVGRLNRLGFKAVIAPLETLGEARTELLSRTKIVLNILNFPWEFPGMRLLMAIGCGALVVSEVCADTRPWIAGEHFVPVTSSTTVETLVSLLNDDSCREALARRARDCLLAQNTMAHSVDQLLIKARSCC
ncbi:MAG: glycosyltransferase [Planctomycetota bacterium]